MSNMSYCRFQNTDGDLGDCQDALEEIVNGESRDRLSDRELEAAQSLFRRCLDIVTLVVEAADLDLDDRESATFRREVDEFLDGTNSGVKNEDDEDDEEDGDDAAPAAAQP